MMRFGLILLTCFSMMPVFASPAQSLTNSVKLLPDSASSSLLVVDAKTGKALYSYNVNRLYPPASVQKVVTALAAKTLLDKDFRFQTDIEQNGDDVIIQFSGDPSLTRDDLRQMLQRLKTKISTIKGNLYINGSYFDEFELASGLPWDNLGVCYSAPASSVTLDGNCVSAKLYYPENSPNKLDISKSSTKPITVVPDVTVKTVLPGDSPCVPKLVADQKNHYRIAGCIGKHQIPMYFNFAVQNPAMYTANIIMQELQYLGIKLQGKIVRNDSVSGQVLLRHKSESLDKLIDVMLKKSDNLIADNLLKTIGRYYYSEAGSFDNGVAAVKAIMKQNYNIDLSSAELADGSGLSRNNRLSAHQIMQVISQIYRQPNNGLSKALPVSGESGTLRYRYSIRNEPLKGRVHGKSGSLYGTYNLAGWVKAKSGKDILFVQMVTHYHQDSTEHPKRAIRNYEKKLYEILYNQF